MQSFKQALILTKQYWKESLLIGLCTALVIFALQYILVFGVFLGALALLTLQIYLNDYFLHQQKKFNRAMYRNHIASWLIATILLVPTCILAGSAFGLISSPQALLTTTPIGLSLNIIAIYFYLIITQALIVEIKTSSGYIKALDKVALESLRNLKDYLFICVIVGLFLTAGSFLSAAGVIIATPLLILSCLSLSKQMHYL
jgi:hypothetical protein